MCYLITVVHDDQGYNVYVVYYDEYGVDLMIIVTVVVTAIRV